MSVKLTRAVVSAGRFFPADTARADAPQVPDGPWWSEPTPAEVEPVKRPAKRRPRPKKLEG